MQKTNQETQYDILKTSSAIINGFLDTKLTLNVHKLHHTHRAASIQNGKKGSIKTLPCQGVIKNKKTILSFGQFH